MYLAFVAYHGTLSEKGTERIAQSVCQTLTHVDSPNAPYCGPSTDENTFEQHMTNVIPYSQLFILVVNDFCPQQNGQIDQRKTDGGAGYLCEEIKAFRNLVKRRARNVKDFAVYYCGNKRKTYDEIVSYVRTLLHPIDPDDTLYTGNDRYIIDLPNIPAWAALRSRSAETDSIFSDEYATFEPLEQKVKQLAADGSGAILLEMKRGMGKTRFVNHVKNDLYPSSTVAIHFTRDQGYVSLGKFRSDFVSQLKDLLDEAEEPCFLDDYGELNAVNFAHYINDFKRAAFPDKTLVICLDSVDDCKSTNRNVSVLDFFSDLSLFDTGVVFLFTAKIPENGARYPALMQQFLSSFTGERITVDENNFEYLQFLYFYYTNHILAKFGSSKVSAINPRTLFEQVKPKDMLSFSILFRVVNLYLSTTTEKEPQIIASIEEALQFYYSFLREHTPQPLSYDDFITALVILSLSDRALNKTELDAVSRQLLNNRTVSETFLKNTPSLSILVNTIYSRDAAPKYEIRHEKIKEMIENDEQNHITRSSLLDNIEFRLDALEYRSCTLLDFVKDSESVIYLFKGYMRHRNSEAALMRYFEIMSRRLSHLNWGDKTALIFREQELLSFVVNSECFGKLSAAVQAKFLTRIGIDEMIMQWNTDSRTHFEKASDLWRGIGEENLSDAELYAYFDFLTSYGNLVTRFDDEAESVGIFKKAVEVSRRLKDKGIIPLRDFTNNLLAYGNVQTIIKQDYAADKKAIDEARDLLENSLDPMDLGQRGWLHQRISYWYECQNMMPESRLEQKLAMEAYEYAFTAAPDSFYFGNLIVSTVSNIRDESLSLTYEETVEYAKKKEDALFTMARQIDFFSAMEESIFYRVMGDVYLRFNRKNEALVQYNKALSMLKSSEKNNGVVDAVSKNINLITDKINAICG